MGKRKTTHVFNETRRLVAGIDLAGAADHYVCGPRRDDGTCEIEHFGTTTPELNRMADWLRRRKVESVAMESTGVYWIPVWDVLEAAGFEVLLVDTRETKMVPGRKSDVKDCQWLQRLHSCGLLRGCFRPPEEYNAVRSVIRELRNITAMRTQAIQAIQKSCDQMNIRIHHAVSDIDGVTGMRILEAIADGERDPVKLAGMRDPRCKKSAREIADELTGNWREEHLFTLRQNLDLLKFLTAKVEAFDAKIRQMYAELATKGDRPDPPPSGGPGPRKPKDDKDAAAKLALAKLAGVDLTKIDGIGYDSAAAIIAEIGTDLTMFPTENHFVSFVGLSPPTNKSAGKNIRTRGKCRNTHPVGQILRDAAKTLWRSNCALGALYRSVRSRSCAKAAAMATAREMCKRIYRGLRHGQTYVDVGAEAFEERRRNRTVKSMKSKIEQLGIKPEELGFSQLSA